MIDRGGPPVGGRAPENFEDEERSRRVGQRDSRSVDRRNTRSVDYRDVRTRAWPVAEEQARQPLRAQWDPTRRDLGKPRNPRPVRHVRKQSRIGRFVSMYGWRAYAIPILLIVTVLVVVDAVRGAGTDESLGETGTPGFGNLSHDAQDSAVTDSPPKADGSFAADLPSGALPAGGPFTVEGAGTWHIVPGSGPKVGEGTEQDFTYTVEVEDGIDTSGFGGDESFGRMVDQTLANPKSWTKDPRFAFRRVDEGDPDFRISLTSQMTVREGCGYDIELEGSCYNPSMGRVLLNEPRWVRGAIDFQGDIGSYRQYQINHEVGHAIGYEAHQPCETENGLAPVMMQQTFGTSNNDIAELDPEGVVPMNGLTCRFNPWPFPRG
nr:DUF3152 domain-containing protein [Rhodococcus sp. WMMA185]